MQMAQRSGRERRLRTNSLVAAVCLTAFLLWLLLGTSVRVPRSPQNGWSAVRVLPLREWGFGTVAAKLEVPVPTQVGDKVRITVYAGTAPQTRVYHDFIVRFTSQFGSGFGFPMAGGVTPTTTAILDGQQASLKARIHIRTTDYSLGGGKNYISIVANGQRSRIGPLVIESCPEVEVSR